MNVKNIVSIERCPCRAVRLLSLPGGDWLAVSPEEWQKVDIIVPARLELSDKDEDNDRRYSAVLSFTACTTLTNHIKRWAYRCTCADGTVYIIGTRRRPFPITTHNQTLPDNPNDSTLPRYSVEYSSFMPVPCLPRV